MANLVIYLLVFEEPLIPTRQVSGLKEERERERISAGIVDINR